MSKPVLIETPTGEPGYQVSANRRQSFRFAFAGLRYALRTQKNIRIMALATVSVIALGFWLDLDAQSWAILSLAIAQVWTAEIINAAIEAAVDLATQAYHPLAKRAKDVAAGAVLLSSLAAAIVGLLVIMPQLLQKLNGMLILPTA